MAKTTAPLLSFSAAGQIGKAQVYATWRGRAYARRYTIPANPRSANQTQTRGTFNFLVQVWKLLDSAAQAPWIAFAKGQPFTGTNAFVKKNLPVLRGTNGSPPANLDGFVGSPGAGGGAVASALVLTDGGTHHAVATLTAPSLPSGWSITAAHAVAIKQEGAPTGTDYVSYYATDTSAPYAPSIAVLGAGTFEVAAWFEYLKPDGTTAYGPSLEGQVVVA
jgi:hypothetical protein